LRLDPGDWEESCVGSECTLHQIAPYIGKMKSSMAGVLIEACSSPGDLILDPFAGSGAIPLEASIRGRGAFCTDINPYAVTLTRAKLRPPANLKSALARADRFMVRSTENSHASNRRVPEWVRSFFHPRTFCEISRFAETARRHRDSFLMACLLGILHHQRPGFLSYPSSHLVPYLRSRKFPFGTFPELYSYRALRPRLKAKLSRVYRRPARLDPSLPRACMQEDFRALKLKRGCIDAIVTSPPYMDTLEYGRDNRLRLWFLGIDDYRECDARLGSLEQFSHLMVSFTTCARHWLRKGGYCAMVVGEINGKTRSVDIGRLVTNIAVNQIGGFKLDTVVTDSIPERRRARKGSRVNTESIVVFRRE
jgi:hypothetical protein